jgi:ABC-type Fe3+-hydroxamate transport system substrate-binding protein
MLRDVLGREFHFESPPGCVVSLVPSVTETLFDAGAGDAIAGRTDYCIFPEDRVGAVESIGGTKNPDVAAIRRLAPDLVYANLEENLERHVREIEEFAPVFVSEPKTIDDVDQLLVGIGEIHHLQRACATLIEAIERERHTPPRARFTFACAIWKKPWMWCGGDTYVSSLVTAAGGSNVLEQERRYPSIAPDEVIARKPDVVFLPDEPFAFTEREADELRLLGAKQVIGPFHGHLFTWHGSRTALGLRFLHELPL